MEPANEHGSAVPGSPHTQPVAFDDLPALLPEPVRALRHADRLGFVLGPGVRVVVSHSPEAMGTAVLLAARIGEVCDALVAVQHEDSASPGAVVLRLVDVDALGLPAGLPEELTREAYRLEVRPHGVLLQAREPSGLMRGAATLLQLGRTPAQQAPDAVPLVVVPAVSIVDHAHHLWRGIALHLDADRDGLQLDTVLRTLERMAELKLDVLQLRVTSSTATTDYEAVVHHASARCIIVVPEVDVVGDPALLDVVAPRTPGDWVHVGGDTTTPSEDDVLGAFARTRAVGKVPVWGAAFLPVLAGLDDAVAGTVLQARDVGVLDRLDLVRQVTRAGARLVACTGVLGAAVLGSGHGHVRRGTEAAANVAEADPQHSPGDRVRALHATRPAEALGVPEQALLGVGSSIQLGHDGRPHTCTADPLGEADDVAAHLAALAELTWSGPARTDWDGFTHRLGRLSGRIGRAPALTVQW